MARKDSDHQKKSMSLLFRGKAICKPLNTGRIDEHVACVREWVANIYFYTKNNVTIMIDAGYNYARLREKMGWIDIDPSTIQHILITHQDTDHVGALETDSELLFRDATVYIGEIENRYLTGETRRKVFHGLYKLPMVRMENKKVLAVRRLLVSDSAFTLEVSTAEEEIRSQIRKLAAKMQDTLDYCRAVVNDRTPYVITQKYVLVREA